MDTLTTAFAPTSQSKTSQQVRMISNHFTGDASQDIPDGINAAPCTFTGVWQMHQADTDALVSFLRAHAATPFLYKLPQDATARAWRVTSWTRTTTDSDEDQVSATLEEHFG
jgi:phage-related protein